MGTDNLFLQEIQLMMHGCGDSPQPLLATARIVATTTRQQILSIIFRAESLMLQGSRIITPRDIVFLLRNKPIKLRRLLQYYAIKTFKTSMSSLVSDAEEMSGKDFASLTGAPEKPGKTPFKEILKLLDTTGELRELLSCNGLNINNDSIKKERDQRLDQLSQNMDPARYMMFIKARRASFVSNQQTTVKFLEWLQIGAGDSPLPKLTSQTVEILAYLAKETVAEIVDLAILVRRDSSSPITGGPLRPLTLRAPPNTSTRSLDSWPALTPAEVRETLRRYFSSHIGFNSLFGRTGNPRFSQQYLAA